MMSSHHPKHTHAKVYCAILRKVDDERKRRNDDDENCVVFATRRLILYSVVSLFVV